MKKISSILLLFTTILLISNLARARSYTFCVYDNPPFNHKGDNGLEGFDIDVINMIIDTKKDKKIIINSSRSLCLRLLKEEIADVVVGNFLFTSSKYDKYKLSTVIYSDPPVLFYRAYAKDLYAINNLRQLSDTPVSIDGTSGLSSALNHLKIKYNILITKEKNIKTALNSILNKHIDYLFSSLDIIGLEKDFPELSALTNSVLPSIKDYISIPESKLGFYYPRGWLFSKYDSEKVKARNINLKLRRIYLNGGLNKLLKKYNLEFLKPQPYHDNKEYQEPKISKK